MKQKLWKKEFDTLLQTLKTEWTGEIREPKKHPGNVTGAVDVDYWEYPEFRATLDGHRIEISLSELPAKQMSMLSAPEDEFLYCVLFGEFTPEFAITVEGTFDRIKKFLKIDHEYQSGDQKFDSDFYLSPRNEAARAALKGEDVRDCIRALEPFALVEVRQGSIFLSRGLHHAELLDPEPVGQTFRSLVSLAEKISRN